MKQIDRVSNLAGKASPYHAALSADRRVSHYPTGDISRTDGTGCLEGLTRSPGIGERYPQSTVRTVGAV
jgi:hypothetical protein